MKHKFIYTLIFLLLVLNSSANYSAGENTNNENQNIDISFRESLWAITHPFIAAKVKRLTNEALKTTKFIEQQQILTDKNGGRLDTFKHAYWMALLSQEIKEKKALKLGKIHELANYKSFKRGKSSQDSIASAMDLLNNKTGANIGSNNKELNKKELITLIIKNINNGKMYIINKDILGNYLDCNNEIIDLKEEKKWHKRKCLISSK